MENELNALESKLGQLIQVCGSLRTENHRLRQELAHSQSNYRQCNDQLEKCTQKLQTAKLRLENLLKTLPEDQP